MPQALPMVAAWAATAWTSAVTVTAGALASVGTVAAIGEGATIALASGILKTAAVTAISAAATALMRPNTPSSGTTLDFKPDPKAPVRGAMGFTAVGGNKVFQATWGYKRVAMSLGVALSLGPIQSVAAFEADGSTVAFNPANQYEALGFYDSDMWQRTTLGLPGDAALLPPTGLKYGNPGLTGWGLQNAAPQTAFAFWTMVLAKNPEDRDIFTNGVPDPRWILNGMRVWQPRFDSTYPGGSGPQRRDDWRTWGWSENPYDHALAWVRGHYKLNLDGSIDKTKRIAGVGAPDSAIDIPAFVEGANIADANGWTISGEWSTSDGKWQTLVAMLQAGGGQPINRGAQISVLVNAPRVSTYTYTKADLVGQAQIKPLTPRRDRKNTIIPRYRSQPNGWEYVAAGEVSASTYRTEDRGEQRSTEVEYVHVRDARQAGQLAAYDLVNLREGLTATLPSKVHLMSVHAGDCITVDVPELALANQKFVVMRTTVDYKSAGVTLELRSETDAKHAFALGQTDQAPPSPTLSAVDPKYVEPPLEIDWGAAPKPPVGGISQPIIVIGGKVETGDIASVIVEAGLTPAGPWTLVYSGIPLLDGRYEAKGLDPLAEYWFSIRYVARNGAISDRLVKGPYVAPTLTAGISPETVEDIVRDVVDQVDTDIGEGIQAGRDALVRARDNALLILQNAKNALEGTLKEEEGRKTQTDDLQDRIDIGFLIDPIAKTGIIRSQVKVEGLNETFVQINTRLVARDAENALQTAQVALDAQAYTNDKVSVATANLVTAAQMNTAISGAVLTMRTYADDKVATATAGLVAVAQMNAAIATSALSLQSYTNSKVSEATAGLATSASVAAAIASSDLALRSYTDGQISTATANLISAAGVDSKIATASLALSSQTDSKIATATANLISAAQLATALAGSELSLKGYTDGQISTATALLASKAEVFANQNLMPNGSGELGLTGWAGPVGLETILWQPYGGQILKQPIPGAASDWYVNGPQAKVSGQGTVTLSWRGGREGGYAGTATVFLIFRNAQGGTVGETPRKDIGTLDPGKFVTAAVPAGAATAQLGIHINGAGGSGQSIWISRVKIENGAVVTPYTLDGTAFSLAATAAIQADAIADAETKLSQARLRLVSAAVGGNPAVVELYSDNDGPGSNFVRISAAQIMLGANTTFDTANSVWRTTAPGGLVRVFAFGSPFGANGDLLEWWGPVGTAIGSMTTGNGYNGRMTTAPYVFDNTQASSFKAVTNTGFIGGARVGAGPVQTSNTVSVTVSGGTGTATIRWVRVSGDSRINMNDPTGFTTGAYATIGVGEVISAYFMGAVTKGGQSAVVYVQVDLSDNGT